MVTLPRDRLRTALGVQGAAGSERGSGSVS